MDYEATEEQARKPVLSDFEQGVVTLPLIVAFHREPSVAQTRDTTAASQRKKSAGGKNARAVRCSRRRLPGYITIEPSGMMNGLNASSAQKGADRHRFSHRRWALHAVRSCPRSSHRLMWKTRARDLSIRCTARRRSVNRRPQVSAWFGLYRQTDANNIESEGMGMKKILIDPDRPSVC